MDVSVIIINYNTKSLLADCLESIYKNTAGLEYEIIVVDNASNDNSKEYITKRFPHILWIQSDKNLGFGQANNLGAKYASGKYLFLLNSDTILINNAINKFFVYYNEHEAENIGALGCWLVDKNNIPNQSYSFFPNALNEIKYIFKCHNTSESLFKRELDVDYIIGADLFTKKTLFEEFNGFDNNIFMYYEETDLQYRMSKANLIRRVISGPRIIHLEGGSFNKKGLSYSRFIMAQTSYNYYLTKHYKGISYIYNKLFIVLIRLTIFITTDWSWKERCQAFYLVLKK